jgi:hypothetical protein
VFSPGNTLPGFAITRHLKKCRGNLFFCHSRGLSRRSAAKTEGGNLIFSNLLTFPTFHTFYVISTAVEKSFFNLIGAADSSFNVIFSSQHQSA